MTELLFLAAVIISIFSLMVLGVDVAFAIGVVGITWLILGDYPLTTAVSRSLGSINSFVLLAIPFFILVAELMNESEVTPKLVRIGNMTTGRMKGGLAQANVITSLLFAGLSGSAVADVAALGKIFIPEMRDEGYNGAFSTALTAATSIIGPIIPPSIILVIYGAITNTSVGALFAAAIIPGILIGVSIMCLVAILAYTKDFPTYNESYELNEYPRLLGVSIIVSTIPAVILIGTISGYFTPTESAAVASIWTLLIGVFIFRSLSYGGITKAMSNTLTLTAQLFIIIALSGMFSWLLAREGVPEVISGALLSTGLGPTGVMIMVALILLFLGTWLDINAAIIILAPILVEVATAVGIHEIQFAMVVVLSLAYGLITPPIGLCLFAASGVSNYSVMEISKQMMQFYVFHILALLLVILFPRLSLYLPRALGVI